MRESQFSQTRALPLVPSRSSQVVIFSGVTAGGAVNLRFLILIGMTAKITEASRHSLIVRNTVSAKY